MLNKITDEQKAEVLETAAHIKFIIDKFSAYALNNNAIDAKMNSNIVLTKFWMDNVEKLFNEVAYVSIINNMAYSLRETCREKILHEPGDEYIEDLNILIEDGEKYSSYTQDEVLQYVLNIIKSRKASDNDENETVIEKLFNSSIIKDGMCETTPKFFDYIMTNSKHALSYIDKIKNSRYRGRYNSFGAVITNNKLSREDRVAAIKKVYTQKDSANVINVIRSSFTNFDVIDDFITATILDNNRIKNKSSSIQNIMAKMFIEPKSGNSFGRNKELPSIPGFTEFAKKYAGYIGDELMNIYDTENPWGRNYTRNIKTLQFVSEMISAGLTFDEQMAFCEKYSWISNLYCTRLVTNMASMSGFDPYKYDEKMCKLLNNLKGSVIKWEWNGTIGGGFFAVPGKLMNVYPSAFKKVLETPIDEEIIDFKDFKNIIADLYLNSMDKAYREKVMFLSKKKMEKAISDSRSLYGELDLAATICKWLADNASLSDYNVDSIFGVFDTGVTDKITDVIVETENIDASSRRKYGGSSYNNIRTYKDTLTNDLNVIKTFADKFTDNPLAMQASENIDNCIRNVEVLINL